MTQEGDFLYLVGGYGTPIDATDNSNAYQTFGHVAKIHVPSMINLVKRDDMYQVDWAKLIAFGSSAQLTSTGGEVYKIGETLYLAGGHNFGSTAPAASQGQQYVDSVYPFTLSNSDAVTLTVSVGTPITDVATSILNTLKADSTSKFRRRDGPIVPALFLDSDKLTQGITFYGGVFMLGVVEGDSTYNNAWNSALYVHPSISASNPSPASPYYTLDPVYDQGNLNVYSCADIEFYDEETGTVHTLLMGGIGDGAHQKQTSMLSGFTNSLMHVRYDLEAGTSKPEMAAKNIFNSSNYYGAESEFIFNPKANLTFTEVNGKTTEILNANATFKTGESVDVGFVYGGIEAFDATPGTYGPGNSAASNKIWKVTITKNVISEK